jgi:mevalonate kinase
MSSVYPSKLLLLGEYTIIQESAALAIPHYKYRTYWSDGPIPPSFEVSLSEEKCKVGLWTIYEELADRKTSSLHLDQLANDLEQGLWLMSNSPIGYGLGSSGAVCAALYDRYGVDRAIIDRGSLQQVLADLESFFHGKSSGIDPLVSYLQRPIWVQTDKTVTETTLPTLSSSCVFLIDSQHPRISTPLIRFFVEQSTQTSFLDNFVSPVSTAVDHAISAWQQGNDAALLEAVASISAKQLQYLPPMILPQWRALWETGLETGDFCLKICGAGGGGFLLGFAKDWEVAAAYFDGWAIEKLDL